MVQPMTAGHASERVSNTQNDVGHDLISNAQERTAQLRPASSTRSSSTGPHLNVNGSTDRWSRDRRDGVRGH